MQQLLDDMKMLMLDEMDACENSFAGASVLPSSSLGIPLATIKGIMKSELARRGVCSSGGKIALQESTIQVMAAACMVFVSVLSVRTAAACASAYFHGGPRVVENHHVLAGLHSETCLGLLSWGAGMEKLMLPR